MTPLLEVQTNRTFDFNEVFHGSRTSKACCVVCMAVDINTLFEMRNQCGSEASTLCSRNVVKTSHQCSISVAELTKVIIVYTTNNSVHHVASHGSWSWPMS